MKHRNLKFFSINDLANLIAEFHGVEIGNSKFVGKKHKSAYEFLLWLDNLIRNDKKKKKTRL